MRTPTRCVATSHKVEAMQWDGTAQHAQDIHVWLGNDQSHYRFVDIGVDHYMRRDEEYREPWSGFRTPKWDAPAFLAFGTKEMSAQRMNRLDYIVVLVGRVQYPHVLDPETFHSKYLVLQEPTPEKAYSIEPTEADVELRMRLLTLNNGDGLAYLEKQFQWVKNGTMK